ncbi:TadE/TadG family type IV pilus assembly protein [Methylobacterium sp. NEAU 140]|uniref:TadE/TadG family type IV pilus assembly protein n=1 Tax=Methylobacterium sp. NEAU 140 TaxID=3064945 RepID=UPI002737792C|nr:TadE/TadG family type IV pilus assembly protein [Methylobacterium sp. NEAU 140]MDP4024238.1 TadE/TadG family type IV pilus assembly protein [Methylobacterium sp. NEAU 140]
MGRRSRLRCAHARPKHRARRILSCRRGGAAVEFALIMPLLLALFAGVTVFGICLGAAHNLRLIAAEAARASIAGVTDTERATLARNTVNRSLTAGAMFRPGSVDVEVGSDPTDADVYTVTVRLDATTLGLNAFSRLLPLVPDLMRSTVSVRRGGL